MTRNLITPAKIQAQLDQGITDRRQVAAALGCHPDSITRVMRESGMKERTHGAITEREMARAKILADEGMPVSWIAEDLGRNVKNLRKRIKPGRSKEWSSAWHSIRQSSRQLELHREFAPRKKKESA